MTDDQAAAVERYAAEHRCPRHAPLLRACHYEHGEPCECRVAVLADILARPRKATP